MTDKIDAMAGPSSTGAFMRYVSFTLPLLLLSACATSHVRRSDVLPVAGGGEIYYEVAGSGPAVVLVHGGFGDSRMWNAQFNELARDFRVVRYDHRGFGRSTPPDSAYSPVRDLVTLLDHLDIDRAHLIGNSVGGGFVLDFALLQPQRTNKVVVVASGANGFPYTREDFASVVAVFNVAQSEGADRAAAMWMEHPMIALSSKNPRTQTLVGQMVRDNKNIFALKAWPEESMTPPAYQRLNELRAPVLFVIGDQDTRPVRVGADSSAARIAGAQVWRVTNADHLPHMLHPAEFNRRVTEFLKR
jgi:3-oxoadipate enol-lactonase